MMNIIFKALEPIGADVNAKDCTRLLRLAGTVHSKSGEEVRIIGGDQMDWTFEDLCEEILPHSRDHLSELRDLRVEKAKRRPREVPRNSSSGQQGNLNGYNRTTLAEERLRDLHTLKDLRQKAGNPLHRDRWLLLASVETSWITHPSVLKEEVMRLAREIGYSGRTARTNTATAIDRAVKAARGEKIRLNGREVDPRYAYSGQRMFDELEVTEEEETHMTTIIRDETRLARRRERKRSDRREKGVRPREEYLKEAKSKHLAVHELRSKGLKIREVAKTLDISESHAKRLAAKSLDPEEGVKSVHAENVSDKGSTEKGIKSVPLNSGVALAKPTLKGHEERYELARIVELPFIDSTCEVYAPVVSEINLEPCIHSYGAVVFPGGKGCYCCDPNHPFRRDQEREESILARSAA
jgi:hypothetical protein